MRVQAIDLALNIHSFLPFVALPEALGDVQMAQLPIHDLYSYLETSRLQSVQELAATGSAPSAAALQRLANLQTALTAVREEIEAHSVKVGGGAETPLK
jgi:hypothetical protein